MPAPLASDQLLARLEELGVEVTTHTHPPLHTVEESRRLRGDLPGGHCKNLFLKDKKQVLWLVVCLEHRRVDMGRLARRLGSARLSFGRPPLLLEVLGVEPGAVSPFALVNDGERRVRVVLDAAMMRLPLVNYHPLTNTATTAVTPDGLRRFISSCGHEPLEIDFGEIEAGDG
jgi:Ala-tRNA(Pro) deacylase